MSISRSGHVTMRKMTHRDISSLHMINLLCRYRAKPRVVSRPSVHLPLAQWCHLTQRPCFTERFLSRQHQLATPPKLSNRRHRLTSSTWHSKLGLPNNRLKWPLNITVQTSWTRRSNMCQQQANFPLPKQLTRSQPLKVPREHSRRPIQLRNKTTGEDLQMVVNRPKPYSRPTWCTTN